MMQSRRERARDGDEGVRPDSKQRTVKSRIQRRFGLGEKKLDGAVQQLWPLSSPLSSFSGWSWRACCVMQSHCYSMISTHISIKPSQFLTPPFTPFISPGDFSYLLRISTRWTPLSLQPYILLLIILPPSSHFGSSSRPGSFQTPETRLSCMLSVPPSVNLLLNPRLRRLLTRQKTNSSII